MQDHEASALVAARGWTLTRRFVDDGQSGANADRPAYRELLDAARRRQFDVLVVWRLDRLGRSLSELVGTLEDLRARNIAFVSVRESFDTTTPSGRAFMQMAAVFAEFERECMRERTRAGLAEARRRGTRLGRPRVTFDVARATALRATGMSFARIAVELGVGEGTVRRALLAPAPSSSTPA